MKSTPTLGSHPPGDLILPLRRDISREVAKFCDEVMPLFAQYSSGARFYFNDNPIWVKADAAGPTDTMSCTKSIVAVAIFKAQQLEILDIDKPITFYLQDDESFPPEKCGDITSRHLLTHTSGMPGNKYFLPEDKSREIPGDEQFHNDRAHELDRNRRAALWEPIYEVGKTDDYSNPGTQLLEGVLAAALRLEGRGLTVEQFIITYVFEPLDMKNSTLRKDGPVVMFNGGLESTAEDLAKLGRFIARAGSEESDKILPLSLIREMVGTPKEKIGGAAPYYGHLWQKLTPGTIAAIGDCANTVFVLPEENIVISRTHPIEMGDLDWQAVKDREKQREENFWKQWWDIYEKFRAQVPLIGNHPLSDLLYRP